MTSLTSVAGQVLNDDRVGAAERVDVDRLDVVDVHLDRAEVARETEPARVRGRLHDFGSVAAVEEHRVGTGAAFDQVAAVARVPLEDVVARAEVHDVVALLAIDEIVVVARS